PDGTVLDGEILPWQDGRPLGFSVLQTRLGRKSFTRRLLQEAPVVFMAYDILEWNGIDIREKPLQERRAILTSTLDLPCPSSRPPLLLISEEISLPNWTAAADFREQ